jgi:hypothetical protein
VNLGSGSFAYSAGGRRRGQPQLPAQWQERILGKEVRARTVTDANGSVWLDAGHGDGLSIGMGLLLLDRAMCEHIQAEGGPETRDVAVRVTHVESKRSGVEWWYGDGIRWCDCPPHDSVPAGHDVRGGSARTDA